MRASIVTMTVTRQDGQTPPANPPAGEEKKKEGKPRSSKSKNLRCAGGQIWEDQSLNEWENGRYGYMLFAALHKAEVEWAEQKRDCDVKRP